MGWYKLNGPVHWGVSLSPHFHLKSTPPLAPFPGALEVPHCTNKLSSFCRCLKYS